MRRLVWPWSAWSTFLLLAAALVALPLTLILAGLLQPAGEVWNETPVATIGGYVLNSLALVAGVTSVTLVTGVSTGWWVAACEFPGRRMLAWLLVLPLAFPAYVAAFGYGDLLDRLIPIVLWVREHWGIDASRTAHSVMRYGAVIAVLSSVLYPYTYLAARTAFSTRSRAPLDAACMLGCNPATAFFRVSLPLARPAIVGASLLVAMEVMNDYGTVTYFGIPTLTVGIFRFWFSFGDPDSALRIAGCAMLVIFLLFGLERWWRGRQRFTDQGGRSAPPLRYRLRGPTAALVIAGCSLPVLIGFFVPVTRLLGWAWMLGADAWEPEFIRQIVSSLSLAAGSTLLILAAAVLVSYAERLHPQRSVRWVARFAVLGYAIPAAVLALGILRGLGAIDALVRMFASIQGNAVVGLFVSGTVAALIFAYAVRFLAVATVPVQAGLKQVCGDLDAAARCLGSSPSRTLARVNLPLLRPVLWSAAILVFVDVLKELPLTLLLRPFNLETLGTRAFNLVDQGRLPEAAPACLLIVGAGLACVVVLNRFLERPIS